MLDALALHAATEHQVGHSGFGSIYHAEANRAVAAERSSQSKTYVSIPGICRNVWS